MSRVENNLKIRIKNIDRVLSDAKPLWNHLNPTVSFWLRRVWETRGFGRWLPLDPIYARRKARSHPGKSILRRDDHYYIAATVTGSTGNLTLIAKQTLTRGIDQSQFRAAYGFNYPLIHERGSRFIPPRPVFSVLVNHRGFNRHMTQLAQRFYQGQNL